MAPHGIVGISPFFCTSPPRSLYGCGRPVSAITLSGALTIPYRYCRRRLSCYDKNISAHSRIPRASAKCVFLCVSARSRILRASAKCVFLCVSAITLSGALTIPRRYSGVPAKRMFCGVMSGVPAKRMFCGVIFGALAESIFGGVKGAAVRQMSGGTSRRRVRQARAATQWGRKARREGGGTTFSARREVDLSLSFILTLCGFFAEHEKKPSDGRRLWYPHGESNPRFRRERATS